MITLSETGAAPFEQIRSQLAGQVTDGTLPAGTRLPTVRGLAEDLGVAPNTVARAYRELEAAGLIETRGRAGTVVSAQGNASRARLSLAARAFAEEAAALGISSDEALRAVTAALGSP